ncbi:M23 family metallopeptidase [Ruegeria atlantica]|uniref:M23 family metallopeptidase n=1 Tax=Ruegeria atlantica TaxID=81569 RepID=UPI00147D91D7|nr:M23 family metallopeptidase [Ruegeria atlantica]
MRSILTALITLVATPAASDFVLRQPVDCVLGETCYIQNYFDQDPDAGVFRDFRCGELSYDGHKGTDFALPTHADLDNRVAVLAAAAGIVKNTRDGVADGGFDQSVSGQECGNGVVIVHEDGWQTQYCHLRMGSVRVSPGDRVIAGAVLGEIGLSGATQFPHLHLSVRKDGKRIDPFAPQTSGDCSAPDSSLWEQPIPYVSGGLLSVGFSDDVPDYDDVRAGTAAHAVLPVDAGAIVLYGHAFGNRKGDVLRLEITGPEGGILSQDVALEKTQAQVFRASGRRLTKPNWPAGEYHGKVTMIRAGEAISQKTVVVSVE